MHVCSNLRFTTLIILMCGLNQCDADETSKVDEAVSLISGYVGNIEAIESFDVLWRCESQWVADTGYIEENVTSGRLVVDSAMKRCCSVMDMSRTKLIRSQDGAVESREVALSAVVSDGVQAWYRAVPARAEKLKNADILYVLGFNSSVLVHAVGTFGFPVYYGQERQLRDHFESLRHGAAGLTVSDVGGGDVQTVSYQIPGKAFTTKRAMDFDAAKVIPVRMVQSALLVDGEVVVNLSEKYRFIEKGGLYMPAEIIGQKRGSKIIDKSNKKVRGTESYDVRLRWFSINEPLDDKYFTPQILNDVKQVTDLFSPKLIDEQTESN